MNDFKARAELAQHTCTGMHTSGGLVPCIAVWLGQLVLYNMTALSLVNQYGDVKWLLVLIV